MKAIGLYVLLKPFDGKHRENKQGLYIPATKSDRWVEAEIISISEEVGEEHGLKAGDKVLYDRQAGNDVYQPEGGTIRVVTLRDLSTKL